MEINGGFLLSVLSLISYFRASCFSVPCIRHILKNGNQNLFSDIREQLHGKAALSVAFQDLMQNCHKIWDNRIQFQLQGSGPPRRSFAFALLLRLPNPPTLRSKLRGLWQVVTKKIRIICDSVIFLHTETISEGWRKKWNTWEEQQATVTLAMDRQVCQDLGELLMLCLPWGPGCPWRGMCPGLSWESSLFLLLASLRLGISFETHAQNQPLGLTPRLSANAYSPCS